MAPTAKRIVQILTGAPDGVGSSDWLARRLECEPEELAGPLAALHDDGRAVVWEAVAPGPGVRGVLGVVLSGTLRPPLRHRRRQEAFEEGITLNGWERFDRLPDPRSVTDRDPCGVPYPGFVPLGDRLQWGEAAPRRARNPLPGECAGERWARRKPCRGCGGRRLSVDTYCLLCDRAGRGPATWGVRHGAEPVVRQYRPRPDLAGGVGRAKEKAG